MDQSKKSGHKVKLKGKGVTRRVTPTTTPTMTATPTATRPRPRLRPRPRRRPSPRRQQQPRLQPPPRPRPTHRDSNTNVHIDRDIYARQHFRVGMGHCLFEQSGCRSQPGCDRAGGRGIDTLLHQQHQRERHERLYIRVGVGLADLGGQWFDDISDRIRSRRWGPLVVSRRPLCALQRIRVLTDLKRTFCIASDTTYSLTGSVQASASEDIGNITATGIVSIATSPRRQCFLSMSRPQTARTFRYR